MTLIKCPECNAVVSNTAKTCPHCGHNIKKHFAKRDSTNNKKFVCIAIAVALCVIGWIVWRAYVAKAEQQSREAAQEWLDNFDKREAEHYLNK